VNKYDIERSILERQDLTTIEAFVAMILLTHRNNKTGLCFPSQSTLARESKSSRSTVIRAIAGLREKGVLLGESHPGKIAQYQFAPVAARPKAARPSVAKAHDGGEDMARSDLDHPEWNRRLRALKRRELAAADEG